MYKPLRYLLLGLALAGAAQAAGPASPERLEEVERRGVHVMPFDLQKTLHIFEKTPEGGVQQVIARDATDGEQIRLIRGHLSQLAARFAQGDFRGPARIHGEDMPGLRELRAGASQVRFAYSELANGAQIVYTTDSPPLQAAIHRYFDAQLSDHARHAVGKHPDHPPHGGH